MVLWGQARTPRSLAMFFFKKRKPLLNPKPAAKGAAKKASKPAAAQKRGTYRANVNVPACYSVEGRPGVRHCRVTDLSAGGCRMAADEDFLTGTLLHLQFKLPNVVIDVLKSEREEIEVSPFGNRPVKKVRNARPFEPVHVDAKNVVVFFNVVRRRFEYGISFHQIDRHTHEEIQRWIHGWQLLQLRNRRKHD